MTPKPDALQLGNFQIPTPCSVPWEEMDPQNGGNRYCPACQHVVHDVTGMSEAEIEALYKQMGGRLCGSIALDENDQPKYFRGESTPKKARYLKHLAVAASLILLYQAPQASGNSGLRNKEILHLPSTEKSPAPNQSIASIVTPETNTLLSGVILTQDSFEIEDALMVEIYAKGVCVARMNSKTALFHVDFAGKLKPNDKVKIVVLSKTIDFGKKYQERKYIGTTIETTLGNAQNVQLVVQYTPPNRPRRLTGAVRSL